MWSDNESEIDLLGFQHYQSVISSIIQNEALLPATIGVYGDWGIGKSTLLKMVEAEFKDNPEVLVLSFNGWLFEGYEDAKTALMGTILDEIATKRKLSVKAKQYLSKLIGRINWMQALGSTTKLAAKGGLAFAFGGLPGLGLAAGTEASNFLPQMIDKAKEEIKEIAEGDKEKIEELDKLIKEDTGQALRRGIREFRKDFGELLKETKLKTLVAIIDDLDRCMPDTIIETLEAIKLFLFVPSTAFILGADERLVKYAVRKRFPELPGERVEVGRDYLEKLIQFPVRIPTLGRAEIETYVNLLFVEKTHGKDSEQFKKACECSISGNLDSFLDVRFNLGIAKKLYGNLISELEDGLWVAQRISPVLATGLAGNPRQCKRFLSTLMMRLEMANSRKINLEQRILAKLMLLEYFKPEFFKKLAELQALQEGRPQELFYLENKSELQPDPDDSQQESKKLNQNIKPQNQELIDTWKSDKWTEEWLKTEPYLESIDLRPYYFFSRDTLGSLNVSVQRMTPKAQEILNKILHESEATQQIGFKESKELNNAEAATIFETLSERAKQENNLGYESSAFRKILILVEFRSELFSQYIAFLDTIPIDKIPISILPKFVAFAKNFAHKNLVTTTLNKWANHNSTSRISKQSQKELDKLNQQDT
jgi:predicted KAP-like P-loop ATPase